ncbi:hypothetical protein [uncultured Hymenobacter sp.]|uniref:hypothetical protein n=1 Tax=uncultured Hymenobacter sp. TaxID=170016 RepID=UPI0035C9EE99
MYSKVSVKLTHNGKPTVWSGKQAIKLISCQFILILLFLRTACCQSIPPPVVARPVEVDLSNLEVKNKLPFDAPFVVITTPTDKLDELKISNIQEGAGSSVGSNLMVPGMTIKWSRKTSEPLNGKYDTERASLYYTTINGEYARPNRLYIITIEGYKDGKLVRSFELEAYTETTLEDNVKLDFGVGYAPKPRAIFGLSSVHLHATAINEDTDLVVDKLSVVRQFLVRTSFFIGLSPITFSERTEQPIKERYALGNFVYGVGFRSPFYGKWMKWSRVAKKNPDFGRMFLQPMRLNIGVLNFSQANQNPAITKDVNKRAMFVSLTYDLHIAAILGPIGKILQ